MTTAPSGIKPQFIVTKNGRSFVRFAGLREYALRHGLVALRTTLVQAPTPTNGERAIVHARVELEDGRHFEDLGDADPTNVGPGMQGAVVRLASTRAKSRALRDAIDVDMVAVEELDGAVEQDDDESGPRRSPPRPAPTPIDRRPVAAVDPELVRLQAEYDQLAEVARGRGIRPASRPTSVAAATAALANLRERMARAS